MNTIREDVSTTDTGLHSVDDATNAFLDRWKDPEEASDGDKGAKTKATEETEAEVDEEPVDEQDEEATEDPNDDTEEADEDEGKDEGKPKKVAEDDAEVTFTVDGVEHKASVKELKRLAGQEAALTRKSQDVAAKSKELEDIKVTHITALNTLVQRAQEKWAPFAEIDMLVAAKEMSSEDFAAVRAEAAAAYNDLQFLTQELGASVQEAQKAAQEDFGRRAQECIKELSDPEKGIKGWNQDLYNQIRNYAVGIGMNAEVVNTLTDPAAFRVLHKAMAYDNIKKVATVKKATTPKKVLKSDKASERTLKNTPNAKSAMAQLKTSGSRDAAANAFLSRWVKDDE